MSIKIHFEIDGRRTSSSNIGDVLQAALLANIEADVRQKLLGISDSATGKPLLVSMRGSSLDNLSIHLDGEPEMITMAKARLGLSNANHSDDSTSDNISDPYAFICHASEDKELARRVAADFRNEGIDAFFDEWEIGPGESIRKKIDEGLGSCTHFIALLTPQSISKPWVNAEIDAAFVKKVDGQCRFVPLRHGIAIKELSPLLRSLNSPSIDDYEHELPKLISFIHGLTEKPPLGPRPAPVADQTTSTNGLSPAATALAKLLCLRSINGAPLDPMIESAEVRSETGLTNDDIIDAYDELIGHGYVQKDETLGCGPLGFAVLMPEAALFVDLDRYFTDWNPEFDAKKIAVDLMNGATDGDIAKLAESYGWTPRRMNPALSYLLEHKLVDARVHFGNQPWRVRRISKSKHTRRFTQAL